MVSGYSNEDVARICPLCGNLFLGSTTQIYCSKRCARGMHIRNMVLRRNKSKVCVECGQIGLEKSMRRRCRKCAADKAKAGTQYVSNISLMKEYQNLLEDAPRLNMRGFIRLQVLAEMFGRDIEEWVNSVPRLAELQARLTEDRRQFDEGEARRKKESDF